MTLRVPRLERLRSIAELAKVVGRPRRTLFRQLVKLHALTRANGGRDWLHRAGEGGKYYVNLSILWSEHPALFERRYTRREEHEALADRVARLEAGEAVTRTRLRTVAAQVAASRDEKTHAPANASDTEHLRLISRTIRWPK